jgi:flagellar motor switch/type III secretory pathway protein FliN
MTIGMQSSAARPFDNAPRPIPSTAANALDIMPWLPCTLTLEIPIVHFTIQDLLSLKPGAIVETSCSHTSDVPLRVNGLLAGWTDFEVIGDRLAVRMTELA